MSWKEKETPWKDEIEAAFQALGGAARYDDLYEYIEKTTKRKLTRNWKSSVRQCIQYNSIDSKGFAGIDLFHHLGKGFWGLRSAGDLSAVVEERQGLSPKEVVAKALHDRRENVEAKLVFVKEHWRKWPEMKEGESYFKLDQALFEVSDAWVTDNAIETKLKSGLILQAPISWFPVLLSAKRSELLEMVVGEFGLFWPQLGFELLVTQILSKGYSRAGVGANK